MSSRRDDISARVVLPPQPVEAAAPRAAGEPDSRSALWATLFAVLRELGVRGALLRPPNGARPPPLDWHPRWPRFAVVDGQGAVAIHSVDADALQLVGTPKRLSHAGIRDIAAVAWRPKAKSFFAVAHATGVCLWTCDAAPPPAPASGMRGLAASTWRCSLLHQQGRKQPVTALCWSPCGQFLSAGSPADSAFVVWEIATHCCTRLRSGWLGGARVLRWSPRGNFLLVAGYDAQCFEIWETHTWTCQSWSTGASLLTDAAWSADETVVLVALSGSLQVAVLHFVSAAPSLLAHLLPLELPGIAERGTACIASIALDASGEKLAVACAAKEPCDVPHWVRAYALQSTPVYAAKLLGEMLPPPAGPGDAAAALPAVAFRRGGRTAASAALAHSTLAVSWPAGAVTLASV